MPLPDGATIVAPAASAGRGSLRIDLESQMTVRQIYRFFLDALRERPKEFRILFTEFDGFDAEISFIYDDRFGFISIVVDCDGTLTAIRAEKPQGD